ncbi:MAG: Holliday junction resolvase RuvX [Coriobacteriales bacterium]|nr:Holliday junction resolvase RuvX [Coriobacteriales bacterium]
MNLLGLDIGKVRTGIAYANTEEKIAYPIKILSTKEVMANAKPWKDLLTNYMPDKLIFGCPVSLDGKKHVQAQSVKNDAKKIASNAKLSFDFYDERLSSKIAKNVLREEGYSEKQMRGKLDAIAASVILQGFLDANFR